MRLKQDILLNKNRYRLYREHKYLFYVFSEVLRLASTLDLSTAESLVKFKNELKKLALLFQSHAEHEEGRIHAILKNKNSTLFSEAEHQHREQEIYLDKIQEKVNLIAGMKENEAHFLSYEIYLDLRNFFSHNLNHFDYEERILMPELHRLLSDDEIREIDRISYRQMSPEEMIDMMAVLFPHMNCEDKFTFLNDIKDCEPKKFEFAWSGISPQIEKNARNKLMKLLNIKD